MLRYLFTIFGNELVSLSVLWVSSGAVLGCPQFGHVDFLFFELLFLLCLYFIVFVKSIRNINSFNWGHLVTFILAWPAVMILHFVIISVCSNIVWLFLLFWCKVCTLLYCVVFDFILVAYSPWSMLKNRSQVFHKKTLLCFNERVQVPHRMRSC